MKKFIKNNKKTILFVIVTAIICISSSVYATLKYSASEISYKNNKSVEQAINELYERKTKTSVDLLWTNSDLSSFSASTISLDLSQYDYIVIDGYYNYSEAGVMSKSIIKKGTSEYINIGTFYNSTTNKAVSQIRFVSVNDTGITFGDQIDYGSNGKATHGIPYHIWGLKLNNIE